MEQGDWGALYGGWTQIAYWQCQDSRVSTLLPRAMDGDQRELRGMRVSSSLKCLASCMEIYGAFKYVSQSYESHLSLEISTLSSALQLSPLMTDRQSVDCTDGKVLGQGEQEK